MNYSSIKVKIKKDYNFELLQSELLQFATYIDEKTNEINFLDAFILLETISKLNFRLRNIIEKHKKPKSISFSVSESALIIKVYNTQKYRIGSLENAVMYLITEQLKQELFSRSN
ncbi:MAG: hypothetical protein K2P85_01830 [Flavobacteriaceae bacterium]|nr:hypothetical protein [Flavobacteriaceae bacterium]